VADEADAPAVSRRAELGFRCFRGGSGSARSRVRRSVSNFEEGRLYWKLLLILQNNESSSASK